jgi:Trypsin
MTATGEGCTMRSVSLLLGLTTFIGCASPVAVDEQQHAADIDEACRDDPRKTPETVLYTMRVTQNGYRPNETTCAGALILDGEILTSGHCISDYANTANVTYQVVVTHLTAGGATENATVANLNTSSTLYKSYGRLPERDIGLIILQPTGGALQKPFNGITYPRLADWTAGTQLQFGSAHDAFLLSKGLAITDGNNYTYTVNEQRLPKYVAHRGVCAGNADLGNLQAVVSGSGDSGSPLFSLTSSSAPNVISAVHRSTAPVQPCDGGRQTTVFLESRLDANAIQFIRDSNMAAGLPPPRVPN